MSTKVKFGAILAGAALLGTAALSPVSADSSFSIHGNGSRSDNNIDVDFDNRTTVSQSNDTDIDNDVTISNITGHNRANDNTGGDVSIETGDAEANVEINNHAGMNVASVNGCCGLGDVDVDIHGNGSRSDNNVDLDFDNRVRVDQDNDTDIDNDVTVENHTGFNRANDNTGGDVSISTGDAEANVDINNVAGFNFASVDSCGCVGDFDVKIAGNGSRSDNNVDLDFDNSLRVDQDNDTDIDNDVDIENITGHNRADDNTGSVKHHFFPLFLKHNLDHDWWNDNDWWKDHDWVAKHADRCECDFNDFDWWKDHNDWWDHGDSGDVSIETGDARADVDINNVANKNVFLSD